MFAHPAGRGRHGRDDSGPERARGEARRDFPIQVGLNQLLSSTSSFNPVAGKGLDITSPELALAIMISILPVLVLFLFSAGPRLGHARRRDQGLAPWPNQNFPSRPLMSGRTPCTDEESTPPRRDGNT